MDHEKSKMVRGINNYNAAIFNIILVDLNLYLYMVVISDKYKLVFIHLHKNAGTFVTDYLQRIDKDIRNIYTNGYGHQYLKHIKKMDIYDSIKDYKFFAVIRHPIDKLLSYYNHILPLKDNCFQFNNFMDFINKDYYNCSNLIFLTDENDILCKDIHLIHYNNLISDLKSF